MDGSVHDILVLPVQQVSTSSNGYILNCGTSLVCTDRAPVVHDSIINLTKYHTPQNHPQSPSTPRTQGTRYTLIETKNETFDLRPKTDRTSWQANCFSFFWKIRGFTVFICIYQSASVANTQTSAAILVYHPDDSCIVCLSLTQRFVAFRHIRVLWSNRKKAYSPWTIKLFFLALKRCLRSLQWGSKDFPSCLSFDTSTSYLFTASPSCDVPLPSRQTYGDLLDLPRSAFSPILILLIFHYRLSCAGRNPSSWCRLYVSMIWKCFADLCTGKPLIVLCYSVASYFCSKIVAGISH